MPLRGGVCRAAWLLAVVVVVAACSPASESSGAPEHVRMVQRYFRANNAAAERGPASQQEFLQRTQHPDFSGQVCELDGRTVGVEPALSTLRRDRTFAPGGVAPRGRTWVVGVEVTVRRNRVVVATQIGSQHVTFLGGRVYGFAPCPA